ncbi:hypothetical protein JFU37_18720 [Pseudomonas sp. TH41]|uniref:hypothetical protein n=1 Tax=Pseudomonas sp. TH41 TaxID=2796405 RepID=UPI0019124EBD|nr:hypothetical protein [Pseudomonas sp. TH41]MBK5354518.1 hypothetical protein [Pseudomonas sp. TH41]
MKITFGCKVWLGETAILFPNLEDAKAYIAQLEERIEAASHTFTQDAVNAEGR